MFYEVQARLLFDNEDETRDFYHDCELALAKTALLNPGQPNIEFSTIKRLDNNHEQEPNEPCAVVESATTEPEEPPPDEPD